MAYLKAHGTRRVPQWISLPGQVRNSNAGYVWPVDVWTRLRRFLILGSEGGSYYASEWSLTRENAQAVAACVREDGVRAVAEIVRVSTEGRAPKNDPALYALALAAGLGDVETRQAALAALPQVARTGTLGCSSGSSAAARRTACRPWLRASHARRRRRRRGRRRRSLATTGCRAR